MMDPETMKKAAEMMKSMSPEDLKKMASQASQMSSFGAAAGGSQMDPAMVRLATEQMARMSPDDIKRAADAVQNMGPEQISQMQAQAANMSNAELSQAARQYQAHQKHTDSYKLSAANSLKSQGNDLVRLQKYREAVEKYQLATRNTQENNSVDAKAVRESCYSNLALCYLKLGAFNDCLGACNQAIALGGPKLKPLYRRAQAYKGLGRLRNAADDLKAALRTAPDDDAVMSALNEVQEMMLQRQDEPEIIESQDPLHGGEEAQRSEQGAAETLIDASGSSEGHRRGNASPDLSSLDPDAMKAAAEAIKSMSPDDLKSMMDISQKMMGRQDTGDSSQMSNHSSSATNSSPLPNGMPSLDSQQMKAAIDVLQKMPQEQKNRMQELAAKMMKKNDGQDSVQSMMSNPEAIKSMQELWKSMSPEDLAEMSRSMGVDMTEDQAKMMSTHMDKLVFAMSCFERVRAKWRDTRQYVVQRPVLLFAIVMLIVGIAIKYFYQ